MPDLQGLCDYGGFTNLIGGDYTASRGVHPGVFRLRMSAQPTLNKYVGPLTLSYGSDSWTYQDCITGPHVQRIYKGRQPYCWSVKIYDKRWKWRYPRISGHYNTRRCDGSIDPDTEKTFLELLYLLLNALGETNTTLRDIPTVKPEVNWDNAFAARELEWLCDWAGLTICPQRNGVILIECMGRGAALPQRNDNISPTYTYTQSVMPSRVDLHSGPTVFQSLLNLEAVGLDRDGSIRLLDDLTIKPISGWSSQWYTLFSDLDPYDRPLAFETVWRWYRLKSQDSNVGDAPITVMKRLKILERLAETHPDDLGVGRCLDAVVGGIFWPLSDHKANSDIDIRYSGSFRVIPHLHVIAFDYPVIKWSGEGPTAASLKIYLSYNAQNAAGEYIDEVSSQAVPQAIATTDPRVEKRRYLKRVRNFESPYGQGQGSDNLAMVQSESSEYLGNIVTTYGGGAEKDMFYGGLLPLDLSGKIAQIRWRWGNDRVATTRAGENMEFDVSQQSHQARRRQERLGQLFDRVMES